MASTREGEGSNEGRAIKQDVFTGALVDLERREVSATLVGRLSHWLTGNHGDGFGRWGSAGGGLARNPQFTPPVAPRDAAATECIFATAPLRFACWC
jgi:hypothetical protein